MDNQTLDQLVNLTPGQLDDKRLELCDRYQKYSDKMIEIEQQFAEVWLELKNEGRTNAEVEMVLNTTKVGKKRIELKYKLKATEKKIGALRDRMRRLDNEAHNTY